MVKNVFVDCFDTILLRKVPAQTIKYLWAQEFSKYLKIITAEELYRMFVSAEFKLGNDKSSGTNEAEYEINQILSLLYDRMKIYDINIPLNQDNFIELGVKTYVEIEKGNVFINKKIYRKLCKLKKNGSYIFLVSDFYCGKNIIIELLKHLKIYELFDNVFVSCDFNLSKKTGKLYEFLLDELKIKAEETLMIGDNRVSDYINPKSIGIKSIKVKERNNALSLQDKRVVYRYHDRVKINSRLKKIFKTGNFVLSNYAFSLFLFINRLVQKLQAQKVNEIFFFSREGQILKILFDNFCDKKGINIKSYYLEVSRNSVFKASLRELENESFDLLVNEKKRLSIFDFLKSLDFDTITINNIAELLNFDINEEILNLKNSDQFNALLNNKLFIKYYNEIRLTQRAEFNEYLSKYNISDKLYVVDVGWKGTMQDCLFKYFGGNKKIEGYYIGYLGAKGGLSSENRKWGLLYSDVPMLPTIDEDIYSYNIYFYEQILRADHNRVVCYKNGNAYYASEDHDDIVFNKLIKPLRDEIVCKFNTICDFETPNMEEQCNQIHYEMFLKIKYKDFNWLMAALNSHIDNFAVIGKVYKQNSGILHFLRFKLSNAKFFVKNTILKSILLKRKV